MVKRNAFLNYLKKLHDPEDYFKGLPGHDPVIPRNLMLFLRSNRLWFDKAPTRKYHHHRYVLIVALKTSGSLIINGNEFLLKQSCAFLIYPHQIHSYRRIDEEKMRWLFLTFEHPFDNQLEPLKNVNIPLGREALECLEQTLAAYTDSEQSDCFRYNETTLRGAIFINLLLETAHKNNGQVDASELSRDTDFLDGVNRYIINNMADGLSIDRLAESLNCSASHLRKKFRKRYGISLGEYISNKKLQKAQSLLMQSGLSMKEISFECGFHSLSSFARFFKRAKGLSPKAYRARHLEQD